MTLRDEKELRELEALQKDWEERVLNPFLEALAYVKEVAEGDGNLVPPVLEAVRAYATVGEICHVLREVFGEYQAKEYYGKG